MSSVPTIESASPVYFGFFGLFGFTTMIDWYYRSFVELIKFFKHEKIHVQLIHTNHLSEHIYLETNALCTLIKPVCFKIIVFDNHWSISTELDFSHPQKN